MPEQEVPQEPNPNSGHMSVESEESKVRRDVLIQALQDNKVEIFKYLLRKLGNHHDAEEAFQEIGLKMCRSQGLYDIQRPALPWLMTIAKRIVLDIVRARIHHRCRIISNVTMSDGKFASKYPTPEEHFFSHERAELVRSAIAGLSPSYRAVLQLALEGMPIVEIAEELALQHNTVAMRGVRGRHLLRKKLHDMIQRDSA